MKMQLSLSVALSSLLISSALCAAVDTTPSTGNSGKIQVNIDKEGSQSSQKIVHSSMGSVSEDARMDQNDRIMRDIQDKLRGSHKNYNINIHVIDGVVTLTGSVKSSQDKHNIESDISSIKDVKTVNNKLEVKDLIPHVNDSK